MTVNDVLFVLPFAATLILVVPAAFVLIVKLPVLFPLRIMILLTFVVAIAVLLLPTLTVMFPGAAAHSSVTVAVTVLPCVTGFGLKTSDFT